MKIFKKQNINSLKTESFSSGEVVVTESIDKRYPFEVNIFESKDNALAFKSLGVFHNLNAAIGFANYYGGSVYTYEYYFQKQEEGEAMEEGGRGSNPNIDSMGDLGWELCIVSQGMFIYKRISPEGPFTTDSFEEEQFETVFKFMEELIISGEYCPLPIEIIPNNMGINLNSVSSIAWDKRDDGQLVNLTIHFIPSNNNENH